jgi:S-DNA-T family DNA segregation ATPase FtsK/SpoIIIE
VAGRAVSRGRRGARLDAARAVRILTEAAGLALLALGLLALLALATWDPAGPASTNAAGPFGAALASLLWRALGPGALVALAAALGIGGCLLLRRPLPGLGSRVWVGAALLLLSLATLPALLAALAPRSFDGSGAGALGAFLASRERALVSLAGALLVNVLALALGVLGVVGVAPGRALGAVLFGLRAVATLTGRASVALGSALARLAARAASLGRACLRAFVVWRARRARRADADAKAAPLALAVEAGEGSAATPAPRRRPRADPDIVDHRDRAGREPEQATFGFSGKPAPGPHRLPSVELFQRPPATGRAYDRESLIMNSRILEKKLLDFGVQGRVVTVHPGPVVTMYEFEPASGIKVNRIVNLADDLALALRALSVRIIAPLPGKSVVGIEVPNAEREVVYLREILESEAFRASPSPLTLTLGKDIFGNPVQADLARMPHLLVAGATGTGKSVFLNSLLCSFLFRTTPAELKLLLIDPKLLELSVYEGIPHLIADVVTNPKRASAALAGIVKKMEERYQMMLALGVRNIAQFNTRVEAERREGRETFRLKARGEESEGVELPLDPLPYIVVVIDELADLMVVSARDVEESLQRLAQMARAAGIHLVLATQRPSVDVLTGIIKANFPARISFQVSSRTDSRTILDQNGAEHLLGDGDMLFLPPGTSKLQRIHGCYVSEKEVKDLATFLREQGEPVFDDTLLRMKEESEEKEKRGDDVDDLYDRAIAIVAETRNASISYLQRRLKVGYNRAARMIEQMEEEGIIGPQDGVKPREVRVRSFDFE